MRRSSPEKVHDAVEAHATLAPAALVVEERRILFRFVTGLLAPEIAAAGLHHETLDDPLVRHRIGEALAGRIRLSGADLEPTAFRPMTAVTTTMRVSVDRRTNDWLTSALAVLHPEIVDNAGAMRLLDGGDPHLTAALATMSSGVALARSISPQLVDDLLPHVTLMGVIQPGSGVVSASSRFFPGLVLVEEPVTPLEIAEALIHEGAHQKLFDLAMTRSFLDARSDNADPFRPSWSAADWPFEQALAACHAYYCLAQFADDMPDLSSVHSFSLLPKARERFSEIAGWLLAHEGDLRADAKSLLRTLRGAPAPAHQASTEPPPSLDGSAFKLVADLRVERTGSGRVLVGRHTAPPEVCWLDGDAAALAWYLSRTPDGVAVTEAAERMQMIWGVDAETSRRRTVRAFHALTRSHLAVPSEKVG